jgi:sialate O-acetylesterase
VLSSAPDFKFRFTLREKTRADDRGRWKVALSLNGQNLAGGPYQLLLEGKNRVVIKDVLIGEVWVASGQSNMWWTVNLSETPDKVKAAADHPHIRLFTVPMKVAEQPQKDIRGSWTPCSPASVGNFSAVAYHFGVELHKKLKVPIGLIHSSVGGTICEAWGPKEFLQKNDELKIIWERYEKGKYNPRNPNQPAVLYNGMIAPLQPYAIKGAIWYQGESNVGRAYQYRTLFPAMIQSWRDTWNNPDMPFLFVQLAPFTAIVKEPRESDWAELREAQLMTLKLRNTGMAVITDVGDPRDIHPKPKQPVGARLALAARGIAYGEKITYSGPIYDSMKVEGNKAIITFKSVGKGLEAKDGELKGFTIAGEDKKFHNAQAKIEGDTVIVTCDKVEKPVAVRYGWANYPVVNLFNKDGLPASPFRTDDFPGLTAGKK